MQDQRQWGRESLTPPALRCAPLIGARLCRSDYRILLLWSQTLFQFLSFSYFRLEDFFLGSVWSPFFTFSTGALGSELRFEILWDVRFLIFLLECLLLMHAKIFFKVLRFTNVYVRFPLISFFVPTLPSLSPPEIFSDFSRKTHFFADNLSIATWLTEYNRIKFLAV